jgi:hypothetical protein
MCIEIFNKEFTGHKATVKRQIKAKHVQVFIVKEKKIKLIKYIRQL